MPTASIEKALREIVKKSHEITRRAYYLQALSNIAGSARDTNGRSIPKFPIYERGEEYDIFGVPTRTYSGGVTHVMGIGSTKLDWIPLPEPLDGFGRYPLVAEVNVLSFLESHFRVKRFLRDPYEEHGEGYSASHFNVASGDHYNDSLYRPNAPQGIPALALEKAAPYLKEMGREAKRNADKEIASKSSHMQVFTAIMNSLLLNHAYSLAYPNGQPRLLKFRDAKFSIGGFMAFILFKSFNLNLITGDLELELDELRLNATVMLQPDWPITVCMSVYGKVVVTKDLKVKHSLTYRAPYQGVGSNVLHQDLSKYLPNTVDLASSLDWEWTIGEKSTVAALKSIEENFKRYLGTGFYRSLNILRESGLVLSKTAPFKEAIEGHSITFKSDNPDGKRLFSGSMKLFGDSAARGEAINVDAKEHSELNSLPGKGR